MKKRYLTLGACSALLSIVFIIAGISQEHHCNSANASNKSEQLSLTEEIHQLVTLYSERAGFNGAVLVAKEDKVIYQNGFGFANKEWLIHNQSDTKFRIGSISKQFTAMLVMQLVEENTLELHTPIIEYLPDYNPDNGRKITLHHLLTHSSGIPNEHEQAAPRRKKPRMNIPDNYAPQDLVASFSDLPLKFEPGVKFDYCNAGYTLLGYILEEVTGETYQELLQKRIFDPLQMKNSGFDNHRKIIPRRASGYFESWGEDYNANYIDMSSVFAAGALYSTVEDLFLWNMALGSNDLLSEKHMRSIFTPHIEDPGYGGKYGYGWSLTKKPVGNSGEEINVICHDGVIDGFCAISTIIPSSESSIILLSNIRRSPLNAMTKGITGILNNKSYDLPRISLAYSMLNEINHSGIEKGISLFEDAKNDGEYYLSEQELNIISYRLYQSNRVKDGISVLRMGVESFPEEWNLYDSLGELLRADGNIPESLENYKKSIELNPNNENGIKMLGELENELNGCKKM